jgi:uncharacterized membrane protein
MNKKGDFALSKVASLLLVLIALFALILFIYFLRDKIKEVAETLLGILRI